MPLIVATYVCHAARLQLTLLGPKVIRRKGEREESLVVTMFALQPVCNATRAAHQKTMNLVATTFASQPVYNGRAAHALRSDQCIKLAL
jgi:hypothetical protein